MKQLTFETLIAVFEEIYGFWLFWGMVLAAALVAAAFLYVLIRDHSVESRKFLRAEMMAPLGAIGAIVFVQFMTHSGFKDIGGPIDVIVLIMIGTAGAVGLTIFAYTAQALLARDRKSNI